MPRVAVIGVGSIGSVLARGFHQLGHEVVVNDPDPEARDAVPFPARTKSVIADTADYIVLAVPTPTTSEGGDPSAVAHALDGVAETNATVVVRSTMPPGSTRRVATETGLPLVYSPEFLRDRSGVDDFFTPDRIVLAGPTQQRLQVRHLLAVPEIDCDEWIEREDYITAELGKYAHNALFATKVSFANQMRAIAERAGADPATVMDIVVADHRNTSSHLNPLLGPYGGECLPKDLGALRHFAGRQDVSTPVLDGTKRMNEIATEHYESHDITDDSADVSATSD